MMSEKKTLHNNSNWIWYEQNCWKEILWTSFKLNSQWWEMFSNVPTVIVTAVLHKTSRSVLNSLWWKYSSGRTYIENAPCNEKGCSPCDKISQPQSPETFMSWPSHSPLLSLSVKRSPLATQCINTSLLLHASHSRLLLFAPAARLQTHPTIFPTEGANVLDSFTIIDLWSTVSMLGHAGYQNTAFLSQWHIDAGTREYYLLSRGA